MIKIIKKIEDGIIDVTFHNNFTEEPDEYKYGDLDGVHNKKKDIPIHKPQKYMMLERNGIVRSTKAEITKVLL